ncbi:Hypothetical predicted protein [Marmota monax]|uniref:Uncharacterized protein n=1 Tax=Marmota monax TaxID=9995 RepID=A0A5E4ALM5_MARMO|nr:Hypothetical predicted protein [Marmota monax]
MLAGRAARTCALLALCLLGSGAQDFGPTRFICTSVPVDADMCAASVAAGGAEELRSNVLQLRETVLQQKETILSQKETIRELTTKLGRCESQSTLDSGPGEARAGGGRKQPGSGKNTMGDLSRTPAAETLSQLGQTLQSLKTRLENLEQYSRLNSSSQTNSLKDLLQSKIDDLERQVLSRVNTLEEGKGGPKNDTEERVKIESALTSLHQRISELEKVQPCNPDFLHSGSPSPGSDLPGLFSSFAGTLGRRHLQGQEAEQRKILHGAPVPIKLYSHSRIFQV